MAGVPAEIEVDLPSRRMTGGDLARLGNELTALIGLEVVVWAVPVGLARVPPGEKIRCL
ncbi:hypothetical protein [Tessaracoccus sp. Y1736]